MNKPPPPVGCVPLPADVVCLPPVPPTADPLPPPGWKKEKALDI